MVRMNGGRRCIIWGQTFLEIIDRKISNDGSLVRYFTTLTFIHRSEITVMLNVQGGGYSHHPFCNLQMCLIALGEAAQTTHENAAEYS